MRHTARCAINICNVWSETVNQIPKARQDQGLLGIPIGEFAMAAEVLRVCPLWKKDDFERFEGHDGGVFVPREP